MAETGKNWGGRRRVRGRTMHPLLREHILTSGLTLDEISSIAGVLPHVMFAWLRGRALIPFRHPSIGRLCEHFGISSEELRHKERPKGACRSKRHESSPESPAAQDPQTAAEDHKAEGDPPARGSLRTGRGLCVPDCPDDCPWRITRKDGDRCPFYVRVPWPRRWGCQFYLTTDPASRSIRLLVQQHILV